VTFALTQTGALVVLFVVLPFIVAAGVVAFVLWRSPSLPPELRTSALLAHGELSRGTLLDWRSRGLLFDPRPMVALRLAIEPDTADVSDPAGGQPFELTITQAVPRQLLGRLERGMSLEVRLSPDRTAGAVVLPGT